MSSANEKYLRSLGWSIAETGGGCRALEFCQDPPQPMYYTVVTEDPPQPMYYTVVTEDLSLPEPPTCGQCEHVLDAAKQPHVVEIGIYKANPQNDYLWEFGEPCAFVMVTWAVFVTRTAQQWHINMLERALSSGTKA